MSLYCDVALPVPLDRVFTYELGGQEAGVGVRVMVPFGGQRLVGIILGLHDTQPPDDVEVKRVDRVLDEAPLLPDELMELGKWIAAYYCAPLGEVLRGMMPLTAEVRRQWTYRIAEQGRKVLYEGAAKGSSRRSRLSVEDQNREYAVLNYLESGEPAKTATLRSATGANKALLDAMAKKRWLVREPLAEVRDARRVEIVAVLAEDNAEPTEGKRLPKLNDNQLAVMAELAGCGSRELVRELRSRLSARGIPDSSLSTLVKRGLVRLEETAQAFHVTSLGNHGKKFAHEHALNEAQTEALATIVTAMNAGGFKPHLLYGITGSGKTAVYIAAMQRALSANKSALLLVPEIGLTPGTAAQMVAAFGSEVALLHSQLTPDERAEQWHRIRRGEARVVIGTRSAVFAPMPNLGLILVDEEHDSSYKQEETPRYHGRDVAVMRAKLLGCTVVLGSATPSLESWNNAERGRYALVQMLERVQQRPLPKVEMIDMREEFRETGKEQLFSRRLIEETQATLDRNEQVIILLNRRGYSFVVMCRSCGEKLECENCAISLTYHKGGEENSLNGEARVGQRLECHYCGYRRTVPKACPKCQSEHLYYLGAGSQQGEERLQELFPGARIGRMDRDTVRTRGDMERLLGRLHSGEINLLVGTQMIAKGHDIHGVTLVGVVGADFALGLPDFRAAERVFQLLTQVSGRAGRGELPGKVLVQTYQPDHYVNQFAITHNYTGFAAREMYFRRAMRYPPLSVLANVILQGEELEEVLGIATKLGRWLAKNKPEGVRVLGPAPAPNARLKRIYRYHMVLKADRREQLGAALRALLGFVDAEQVPRRAVVVDVDPVHLM
ncbi:primosomal protein N' [Granulicella sp. 5B5]|uniref:replication restart helicase PriA n=1 Tax=Granulicella sp. 5B5 TaxID=1617967 RepID=UPI0015F6E4A8|nr:primosomal protein N' [Granulicella sp. 5B5]QMV17809.1 primosomal protein N' [Granulicella sp. 5B5]